jgi:hypothetical protein
LGRDRPVQSELLADFFDLLRGAVVAGQHRGRIARCHAQHEKDEKRHHPQYRDGGEQASENKTYHLSSSLHFLETFQK